MNARQRRVARRRYIRQERRLLEAYRETFDNVCLFRWLDRASPLPTPR